MLTRHSEQFYISQTPRESLLPPPSSSRFTLTPPSLLQCCLFLSGKFQTLKMQQNGKWSSAMAFKALGLPGAGLFIFTPNKWWRRNPGAKTEKQKHWALNQAFVYKVSLITLFMSSNFSLQVFTKRTIECVNHILRLQFKPSISLTHSNWTMC